MLLTCLRPGFRPGLQLARIMECGLKCLTATALDVYSHPSVHHVLEHPYGHIKTAEEQTTVQQYGDWYIGR